MRIRISEPALMGDLLEYFQQDDCVAIQAGADMVAVSLVDELPYDAARYAIGFHLSVLSDPQSAAFFVQPRPFELRDRAEG
jgi:hypothetical protein